MTFAEAFDKAAADADAIVEQAHDRFEQSLIDHRAADHLTAEQIDDLLDCSREYLAAWRERTLETVREKLREPWETVH